MQNKNMQIVINISEKDYNFYKDASNFRGYSKLREIMLKGTILPKGHGRIGDLDALEEEMVNGIKAGNYEDGYDNYPHINNVDDCVECVKYADTIIEADNNTYESKELEEGEIER